MDDILRFPGGRRNDPLVEAWLIGIRDPLGSLARTWFDFFRDCGEDVCELLHDGCPVACVGDAPFGYVNAFKTHTNIGFFHGASLPDPSGLLEGQGKRMRHVKVRPGEELDFESLRDLISAAYEDIQQRLLAIEAVNSKAKLSPSLGSGHVKSETLCNTLVVDDIQTSGADDWRNQTIARVRRLIQQADPEVVEEIKWRKPSNSMAGVPVWSHDGIICTGETYKNVVKLTFARGAALDDPSGIFNASLNGNARRAIDIHEGEPLDEVALRSLIIAAVALNKAALRTDNRRKNSGKK